MAKSRLKSVKSLVRSRSFPDIERWIYSDLKSKSVIAELRSFTDPEFEKLSEDLIYYGAMSELWHEIERALTHRTQFYVRQLQRDILKLGKGAFRVHQPRLKSMVKNFSYDVELAMSRIWIDPNVIYFDSYDFPNTLNAISKIRRSFVASSKKWSQAVKHKIKRRTNRSIDLVKALQKLRYGNSGAKAKYKAFIGKHFLGPANEDLTKFLTGVGRPQDADHFDDLRRKNRRYSKKSAKF